MPQPLKTEYYYQGKLCEEGNIKPDEATTYTGTVYNDQPFGHGHLKADDASFEYKGEFLKLGIKHGFGHFQNKEEGFNYEGHFEDDEIQGEGKFTNLTKDSEGVYKGFFIKGELNCKQGTFESEDRTRTYRGGFKDGKFHGAGQLSDTKIGEYNGNFQEGFFSGTGFMKYTSGESYEGQWVLNKRNGEGKLITLDGSIYKGSWQNDVKNGLGELTLPNYDKYECTFIEGVMKGKGKILFQNGDVYTGDILERNITGTGAMQYKTGASYEGEWLNGLYQGKGTYIDENDIMSPIVYWDKGVRAKNKFFSTKYGKWKGGFDGEHPYGNGIMSFPEGSRYEEFEGFWDRTAPSQTGKLLYRKTGLLYEGEFVNGKREGTGKLSNKKSGDLVYEGEWKNDLKCGQGVLYFERADLAGNGAEGGKRQRKGGKLTHLAQSKGTRNTPMISSKGFAKGFKNYSMSLSDLEEEKGQEDASSDVSRPRGGQRDQNLFERPQNEDQLIPKNSQRVGGDLRSSSVKKLTKINTFRKNLMQDVSETPQTNNPTQLCIYRGHFEADKMHGRGVLKIAKLEFSGVWIQGKMHGKFEVSKQGKRMNPKFFFQDLECKQKETINRPSFFEYYGNYGVSEGSKELVMHGLGTKKFKNAQGNVEKIYSGEFFENEMHGKGKMTIFSQRVFFSTISKAQLGMGTQFGKVGGNSIYRRNRGLERSRESSSPKRSGLGRGNRLEPIDSANLKGGNRRLSKSTKSQSESRFKSLTSKLIKIDTIEGFELSDASENIISYDDLILLEKYIFNSEFEKTNMKNYISLAIEEKNNRKLQRVVTQPSTTPVLEIEGTWNKGRLEGQGRLFRCLQATHKGSVISRSLVYEGEFSDNEKQGIGKYFLANNFVYIGEFYNNTMNGNGTLKKYDGSIYQGSWVDGKMHGGGELKQRKFSSSRVAGGSLGPQFMVMYKGEWESNQIVSGEWIDSVRGLVYKGEFKNGKKAGKGVLSLKKREERYEGEFLEDKFYGEGEYSYANGDVYKGTWVRGKREGQGVMVYKDGGSYEGSWINGKRSGLGKMVYEDRQSYYEGEWLDDQQHGKGKQF